MRRFYFDAFPADDPNGTALGELDQARDRHYRAVDQGIGTGTFTINRHDSQYLAGWCADRTLVRVRLESGGPFAFDDTRYVGAFWIEEATEVVISSEEEGGEDVKLGGRSGVAILDRAVIYPDADFAADIDARRWANTRKTGQVEIFNQTPGETLRILLRNATARTPDPLAPSDHDFDTVLDSAGVPWPVTDTDWKFPVGEKMLATLAKVAASGTYWKFLPRLRLQAFNTHPGIDRSATVTFAKAVDVRTSAERSIHARPVMSRVIVSGAKADNELVFREVVDAALELEIGRIEGFAEYKATPTTARLDLAGEVAIANARDQRDGPTTAGILELSGKEPFVDYDVGDLVTFDVPGIFDDAVVRIAEIILEETASGEMDPDLVFTSTPFDPSSGPNLFDPTTSDPGGGNGGPGGAGGGKACGDCPEPQPYVPVFGAECAPGDPFTPSQHFAPNFGAGADAAGLVWYSVAAVPVLAPRPFEVNLWGFPAYNVGGADFAGDCTLSALYFYVVGPGRLTLSTAAWPGPIRGMVAEVFHVIGGFGAFLPPQAIVPGTTVTIDVDTHDGDEDCAHIIRVSDGSGPCGGKWGWFGADWESHPVEESRPDQGQWTTEEVELDAGQTTINTNYPYTDGSPEIHVDGVLEVATPTDPDTGELELAAAFPAGTKVQIKYQIVGPTALGTGNTQPVPTASVVPYQTLPVGTTVGDSVADGGHTHSVGGLATRWEPINDNVGTLVLANDGNATWVEVAV